jgi:DNA-binding MarR family transcriptional regulator
MELLPVPVRQRQLDDLAEALPRRAGQLTRLFLARSALTLTRTEIGVLAATSERAERITDLAAAEGVTQPAITMLVNRLQARGWLRRRPDPSDRRAVRVEATPAGRAAFHAVRAEYRAFFHGEMASLADEEVETLARAVAIIDKLVSHLEGGGNRP